MTEQEMLKEGIRANQKLLDGVAALLRETSGIDRKRLRKDLEIAEWANDFLRETEMDKQAFAKIIEVPENKIDDFLKGAYGYSVHNISDLEYLWKNRKLYTRKPESTNSK